LDFPPFHLLPDIDLLYRGEELVTLQPRAAKLLRYLVENHERVVSKAELLEHVWPNVFTGDAVLKQAMAQVRRALGDDAQDAHFIETFHARGYQFIASVNRSAATRRPSDSQTLLPDFDQLIGRELELEALRAEYRRTLGGHGQPVLIIGEAGAGKTQLARRFEQWAQTQGALCLYARFFDYGASQLAPYEIFLGLLRTAVGSEDLRQTVLERFGVELPPELTAPAENSSEARVGSLAGDRFRLIAPIGRTFAELSRECPVVLILDDLQWADEASRDCIGYMMRADSSNPLMILGLARSSEIDEPSGNFSRWLKLQASYRSFSNLALRMLDEHDCARAIEAIFGGKGRAPEVPAADLRMLCDVTEGNPYFLTEMLRLLQAEGVISCLDREIGASGGRWRWLGIHDLHLPATLVLMAQAKLDRLSPETRAIVEHAAVIGDEFRIETIALTAQQDERAIERAIEEGVRSGILSEKGLSSGEDCRFYHSILRHVVYYELSPRKRKRLHAQTARALESVYRWEADRVAAAISAQHESAGDARQTFEWGMRAWRAARSRWQWREAAIVIERAWHAIQPSKGGSKGVTAPEERLECLIGLGETYRAVGRMKDSEEALDSAILLAETLSDRVKIADALLSLSQTRHGRAHYRETIGPADRALQLYGEMGDQEGVRLALLHLSNARVAMGDYDQAAALLELMLQVAPQDSLAVTVAYGILGWARVLEGRGAEGINLIERAIEGHRRAGNIREVSQLERHLHWAHLRQGDYETAIRLAIRARDGFSEAGDSFGEARANMGVGQARIAQGLYDEGIEIATDTLRVAKAIGDAHCEAEALWLLAQAESATGQLEKARTGFDRALEIVRAIGDRDDEFRILIDVAALETKSGDARAGLCAAEDAVAISRELSNPDGIGAALAARSAALLALGSNDEALLAAEQAIALLEESNSGERWRAYWVLARIFEAKGDGPAAARAYSQAVVLLEQMREQFDESDVARRETFTRAHAALLL
jgi:DNA-binding winged helix-turn-helix (wHTH) protein